MSKPMLLADFVRLPPTVRGDVVEGLAAAIDIVAERGAPSHRFLRFGWYAAALTAYGGAARTLVVEEDGTPVVTLPFVAYRPFGGQFGGQFGIVAIPGCRWPFRSLGVALGASDAALRIALVTLGGQVNGLRLGPICEGDAAATALIAVARALGWIVLDRPTGRGTPPTRPDDHVFWQAAVADPVLADMIRTSGPTMDGALGVAIDTGDGVHVASEDAPGQSIRSLGHEPTRDWLLLRPGLPAIAGRMLGGFWQRSGRFDR